jgi:hypothetical protein
MPSEQPPSDATNDIFSLSDRVLSEKLLFVKEVRFPIPIMIFAAAVRSRSPIPPDRFWKLGQCLVMPAESVKRRKRHETRREACAPIPDSHDGRPCSITVSVPFRSCHAAFLRGFSLRWNEMKVVRTFKNDPHPSIVPFHSFIITPSYALITM